MSCLLASGLEDLASCCSQAPLDQRSHTVALKAPPQMKSTAAGTVGHDHSGDAFVARHNGCEVIIRVLLAQLRQCEVLRQEDEAGKELTGEEQRKLGMMFEWKQQLAQLEG